VTQVEAGYKKSVHLFDHAIGITLKFVPLAIAGPIAIWPEPLP
jgi:hypothetical protein